ncbi:YbhB/YbcL family Raf kinase inhibitor-like protein [Candidatus Omnitrophota bacterium]
MKKYSIIVGILFFVIVITLGFNTQLFALSETKLQIESMAFKNNEFIPTKYTRFGENINPPLRISNIPDATKSLVLIVDDPDAPSKTWVHWVVFNIPVVDVIEEKSAPGIQGKNDFGNNQYDGPQPPSGTHRYFFKLYALDIMLSLADGSTKEMVLVAMEENVIAQAQLVGLYKNE